MRRFRVIFVSLFSFALATAMPFAMARIASKQRAKHLRQDYLTERSQAILLRAERTYNDAVAALKEVESGKWTTCSPAHIEAMRIAAFNHHSISEIGFINKANFLACTSWGMVGRVVPHGSYTFVRRDGIGIHLGIKPIVVQGNTAVAINYGSHNALVDPSRMTDLALEQGVSIAVANEDGHVVATLNHPAGAAVAFAIAHPGPGTAMQHLYSSSSKDGWTVVAMEDGRLSAKETSRQESIFFPIALFASAAIGTAAVLGMRRRFSPVAELENGLQNREFVPHYQPILHLATRKCIGAEALVRWERRHGALVMPAAFLPLADQNGLLEPITDQLIQGVIDDMGDVLHCNPALHITFNLSSNDMETGRPFPLLTKLLASRQLPARCIWLEATEQGFINADAARKTLNEARGRGHVIAIDDFGTGYSSLSLLHSLPVDLLKIDRTFVEAIATESAKSKVVDHIIDLAKELNLVIIAEGIETEQQAAYLQSRDVTYGQGYLYGRPMPKDDFLAFLVSHQRDIKSTSLSEYPAELSNRAGFHSEVATILRSADTAPSSEGETRELEAAVEKGFQSFVIGAHVSAGHPLVARILTRLRRSEPQLDFSLIDKPIHLQKEALIRGEIQACFMYVGADEKLDQRLEWEVLTSERLVAALPTCHALAQADSVSLEELAEENLVVAAASLSQPVRSAILLEFSIAGLQPKSCIDVPSVEAAYGMINLGECIGFVPQGLQTLLGANFVFKPIVKTTQRVHQAMVWGAGNTSEELRLLRRTVAAVLNET